MQYIIYHSFYMFKKLFYFYKKGALINNSVDYDFFLNSGLKCNSSKQILEYLNIQYVYIIQVQFMIHCNIQP